MRSTLILIRRCERLSFPFPPAFANHSHFPVQTIPILLCECVSFPRPAPAIANDSQSHYALGQTPTRLRMRMIRITLAPTEILYAIFSFRARPQNGRSAPQGACARARKFPLRRGGRRAIMEGKLNELSCPKRGQARERGSLMIKHGEEVRKLRERFQREAQSAARGRESALRSPAFRELVERLKNVAHGQRA